MSIRFTNELSKLEKLGIALAELEKYQVLLLPENLFGSSSVETLREAGDSMVLSKELKAQGIKCATAFDLGLKVPTLERRSKDHWFGTVWVRDVIAVPLIVGVISSLIATSLSSNPQAPQPNVHLDLYIQRGTNLTKVSFNGDGPTLIQMLKSIPQDDQNRNH